jgi:hypothetical protein
MDVCRLAMWKDERFSYEESEKYHNRQKPKNVFTIDIFRVLETLAKV